MSDIETSTYETANGVIAVVTPKTRKPRTSGGGDVPNALASTFTSIPDLFAHAHAQSAARRNEIAEEIAKLQTENEGLLLAEGGPRIVKNIAGTLEAGRARHGKLPTFDASKVRVRFGIKTERSSKPGVARAPKKPKSQRLARRSEEQIDEVVDQVVALVKKAPEGLRAEHIRQHLGLEAKELPRVFKRAIQRKVLKAKGSKRATVYSPGSKS